VIERDRWNDDFEMVQEVEVDVWVANDYIMTKQNDRLVVGSA
jgi:hypothetical protein